ncbi:hypothetical protein HanHA89_Chr17g0724011 [Helianthus annuus]|nr:hypothetical protein HanHA89_Chr17g0724011 [Helianthus annuus]
MAGGSITGDSCIQNQKPKNRFRTEQTFFPRTPFVSPTSSYLFLSLSLHFLFFTSFLPVIRPNPLLYSAISSTPFLILQSITCLLFLLFINHHDFTFPIALFVDQKFNQE